VNRRSLPGRTLNETLSAELGREVVKLDALPIADGQLIRLTFEGGASSWRQGVRVATQGTLRANNVSAPQLDLWPDTAPPTVEIACESSDGLLRVYTSGSRVAAPASSRRATHRECWSSLCRTVRVATSATTSGSLPTSRSSSSGSRSPSARLQEETALRGHSGTLAQPSALPSGRRGFCASRGVSSSRELSGWCCRAPRDRAHVGRLREHSSGEGDQRCEPANERCRRRRAVASADEVFVRRGLESGSAPVRARLGTPSARLGGNGEQRESERDHRLLRRRRARDDHGEERDSNVPNRPLCAARPSDDSDRDVGAGTGRELGASVPSQDALRKRQRLCRPRRNDPSRRPLHGKLALPANRVS